jgi:glucose/arabinose dehydrogenase
MNGRIYKWLITSLLVSAVYTSCQSDDKRTVVEKGGIVHTELMTLRIDTLARGLENPWAMAFLPDGRILISERPGRIRIWDKGKLMSTPVSGVPEVWANGQGGLLDLALHPDFKNNGWLYMTYSAKTGREASTTLARASFKNNALTDFKVIFKASPSGTASHHFGSRIALDGKGYLFMSIGDRGIMEDAQNLGKHSGKIIRLTEDGDIPADNPFRTTPGALPEIWSYGHRNPQGLVFDANGQLWAHEHGPKGGDELNHIQKGKNYGWPLVTYGINYNGNIISKDTAKPGLTGPVYQWTPSIAPCGMAIVSGEKFSRWKGNYLVGALAHQHIQRLVLSDGKVLKTERILNGFARFRDVRIGPDGFVYALTESPGLLIRLKPI